MRASRDFAVELEAAACADADRGVLLVERLVVLVEENLRFARFAVDVDADARGQALAVIGDQHVLPFVELDGLDGLDAKAEIGEAMREVQAHLAVHQVQAVALAFHVVVEAGENGAIGQIPA